MCGWRYAYDNDEKFFYIYLFNFNAGAFTYEAKKKYNNTQLYEHIITTVSKQWSLRGADPEGEVYYTHVITNSDGVSEQVMSFDVFGARRMRKAGR